MNCGWVEVKVQGYKVRVYKIMEDELKSMSQR